MLPEEICQSREKIWHRAPGNAFASPSIDPEEEGADGIWPAKESQKESHGVEVLHREIHWYRSDGPRTPAL